MEPQYDFGEQLASIKRKSVEHISKEEFEWRVKEIARCKRDIVYFAEHYVRIMSLDKGLHIIKLYGIQKEFLRFLVDNNKVICVSGRQQGKSTIYCIYALWQTTFFAEKKIMILANKAATALELLSKISMAYQYLPDFLKSSVVEFNKSTLSFANLSSIRAFASSSDAARGFSCNCIILDEFAFLQKNLADKLFTSMYPTISSSKNGKMIIVSTPNGAEGLYYDIWLQANSKESGKNKEGWKPFTMWWWQVPGHDEKWKEKQIAAIGAQRFAQEFNNEFLANSTIRKLIPDDIIEKHRIKLSELKLSDTEFAKGKKQQILSEDQTKMYEFTMWHEFNPQRTYLASGDCAEGIGGDDSVLYVWDVTDLSNIVMCAKFDSNRVSTVEFAFITRRILKAYNDPYYICERNGVGSGYLDSLRITYGYQKCTTEGKNSEAGVYSHAMVKGKSCIWAREMMTTDGFNWTIYDKDLINEMATFVRKENKGVHLVYQAVPPAHDDHIMAWIWACYILQPELVEKYFVCAKTFRSQLDKTYPQRLEPLKEYSNAEVKAATNDPLYQEFLDFKEEIRQKLGRVLEVEKAEGTSASFRKQQDIFFGDSDDGPSWNSSQPGQSTSFELNSNNRMPSFFINAGGGFI